MRSNRFWFSILGITALLLVLVMGNLGINKASAQSNLLTNPGLESGASQTPTGWSESGSAVDASKSETGSPHAGTYKGTHWKASAYDVFTFQTKTSLTNGTYTLRAWVMSGGGQTTAVMKAQNCGGSTLTYTLPTTSTWTQISLSVPVTNGQCTVGFSSVAAANQWLNFDDVEFFLSGTASTPTRTPTPVPGGGLSIKGADVSTLQQAMDLGQVYYNASGTQQNALDILKGVGVNYIRLRVWVNPVSGYNNMAKVIAFAPQVKSRGMKLLVDLHYSDTWADPGHQTKPSAWNGHSLSQLQSDVYNYTFSVCNGLKNAGATPDMMQVGNEITAGMLWNEGKIVNNDFAPVSSLIKQGYNAVKACNSSTQVMLHTDRGGDNAAARWWYDGVKAQGVQWDVTGLSFYCYWHGTIPTMQSNVADMKSRYGKPVVIAETAYPFSPTGNGDSWANEITATTPCSGYASSPTGQASYLNALKTALTNAGGAGFFYWEPTWVATHGIGWNPADPSTGNAWDNQTVFDFNFKLNPNISWNP